LVSVATTAARPAQAFETGGALWPTSNGCVGTCAGQPRTIRYTIGNITDGSILMPDGNPLPTPLIKASIEKALWFWTTAVNFNFVEVPDGPLTQLRFRYTFHSEEPTDPQATPQPKAFATCIGAGSGCEVQYDAWDRWQEAGTLRNPDILGASIHEVGHILGLEHTLVDAGQNMFWIFHRYNGLNSSELAPANIPIQFYDDIAGIQSRYGAGVGSVTPLGVPEPNAVLLAAIAMMGCLPLRRRRSRS
jgi:hypothetical protein